MIAAVRQAARTHIAEAPAEPKMAEAVQSGVQEMVAGPEDAESVKREGGGPIKIAIVVGAGLVLMFAIGYLLRMVMP